MIQTEPQIIQRQRLDGTNVSLYNLTLTHGKNGKHICGVFIYPSSIRMAGHELFTFYPDLIYSKRRAYRQFSGIELEQLRREFKAHAGDATATEHARIIEQTTIHEIDYPYIEKLDSYLSSVIHCLNI